MNTTRPLQAIQFNGIEVDSAHFATAERRIAAARAETPLFAEND